MLRNADNVTYPQWQSMAYDTRMYWPMTEIPKLSEVYERLKTEDAALAEEVAEYPSTNPLLVFSELVDGIEASYAVA